MIFPVILHCKLLFSLLSVILFISILSLLVFKVCSFITWSLLNLAFLIFALTRVLTIIFNSLYYIRTIIQYWPSLISVTWSLSFFCDGHYQYKFMKSSTSKFKWIPEFNSFIWLSTIWKMLSFFISYIVKSLLL